MQLNVRRVSGHKFEPLSIVFSEFPEIFVMGAEITNRFLVRTNVTESCGMKWLWGLSNDYRMAYECFLFLFWHRPRSDEDDVPTSTRTELVY